MMSVVRSRLRAPVRRAAALMAWAGLLALPAQTLAGCPMLETGSVTSAAHLVPVTGADAEHGEYAEHAGHAMPGAPREASDTPTAPAHQICPDLAHCAVAAIPAPSALPTAATLPAVPLRLAALTAPRSAARAVEPRPPKA